MLLQFKNTFSFCCCVSFLICRWQLWATVLQLVWLVRKYVNSRLTFFFHIFFHIFFKETIFFKYSQYFQQLFPNYEMFMLEKMLFSFLEIFRAHNFSELLTQSKTSCITQQLKSIGFTIVIWEKSLLLIWLWFYTLNFLNLMMNVTKMIR